MRLHPSHILNWKIILKRAVKFPQRIACTSCDEKVILRFIKDSLCPSCRFAEQGLKTISVQKDNISNRD